MTTAAAKTERRVYLGIDKSSIGPLQLSINVEDADGGGHGYRLFGPKYDGRSASLHKHYLTERDVSEIESYLAIVKRS